MTPIYGNRIPPSLAEFLANVSKKSYYTTCLFALHRSDLFDRLLYYNNCRVVFRVAANVIIRTVRDKSRGTRDAYYRVFADRSMTNLTRAPLSTLWLCKFFIVAIPRENCPIVEDKNFQKGRRSIAIGFLDLLLFRLLDRWSSMTSSHLSIDPDSIAEEIIRSTIVQTRHWKKKINIKMCMLISKIADDDRHSKT